MVVGLGAFEDEDDVEVAGVGQLGAAEAPEGDDGEGHASARTACERDLEGGLGDDGDVVADRGHVGACRGCRGP